MSLKRYFWVGILLIFMCVTLTGCCLRHEWQEATCTSPKTCAKCGKTEGEVIEHTWQEATCEAPKTCSECKLTEGEALGHTWTEATCTTPKTCSVCKKTEGEPVAHTLTEASFQSAASCTVCGAAEGEPRQADFEKYGFVCNDAKAVVGKSIPYKTICYSNPEFQTTADAKLVSFEKVPSTETHEALEGYEWILADFEIFFHDYNARNYGMAVGYCTEDYYTIKEHDDSLIINEDDSETYTVNFNGQDYTECMKYSTAKFLGWTDEETNTYQISLAFRVPVDYDGTVVGLRNRGIEWGEGQYLYDLDHTDTIFYRFQ